jgi:N-acyl-D-aspartate/D-glutamate deacylase
MSQADLVIRGGLVFDGLGDAPVRADIAITGERITAVGAVPERGREEIDASGLMVAPAGSTSTPTTTARSPGTRG